MTDTMVTATRGTNALCDPRPPGLRRCLSSCTVDVGRGDDLLGETKHAFLNTEAIHPSPIRTLFEVRFEMRLAVPRSASRAFNFPMTRCSFRATRVVRRPTDTSTSPVVSPKTPRPRPESHDFYRSRFQTQNPNQTRPIGGC